MNPSNIQFFVDLDGVLADFNEGVIRATGTEPHNQSPKQMWPVLARTPGFYEHLEWMSDGKELWNALCIFNPVILTGVPWGNWAEQQKRIWCARELGKSVPVITGSSSHKAELACTWLEEKSCSDRMHLLIDDRLKIKEKWEASEGIFILHTSAKDSLAQLRKLAIL